MLINYIDDLWLGLGGEQGLNLNQNKGRIQVGSDSTWFAVGFKQPANACCSGWLLSGWKQS